MMGAGQLNGLPERNIFSEEVEIEVKHVQQ
jgi:hypothetical protein